MISRRIFLKIGFAAGIATAVPVGISLLDGRPVLGEHTLPIIMGDGIHDDTAGLQAALAGLPFIANHDCVQVISGTVTFRHGTFRMRTALQDVLNAQ